MLEAQQPPVTYLPSQACYRQPQLFRSLPACPAAQGPGPRGAGGARRAGSPLGNGQMLALREPHVPRPQHAALLALLWPLASGERSRRHGEKGTLVAAPPRCGPEDADGGISSGISLQPLAVAFLSEICCLCIQQLNTFSLQKASCFSNPSTHRSPRSTSTSSCSSHNPPYALSKERPQHGVEDSP